ncbi:zinc ribbon domain-containing protein [Nocardia sp. 004]|uniref:zinc ribbon domain-containing protein n=1 Tax=Nocardia sp. 004 TaxID=3385978 RepID=UPI0039A24F59
MLGFGPSPTSSPTSDLGLAVFAVLSDGHTKAQKSLSRKQKGSARTTRRCSVWGVVGDAKPLHVRTWPCACGAVHGRDLNAAVNILAESGPQ